MFLLFVLDSPRRYFLLHWTSLITSLLGVILLLIARGWSSLPLVISGPVLRSRSCHLYGGAGADFLVGRNRELAPAGFSFRKTKLKSFVLIIKMKSVLFKKTNMIPKRFLLITKFIRAKKKNMSGAGVGSGTSDLRSRSKKWRLRNTASLYHELGTKIVF